VTAAGKENGASQFRDRSTPKDNGGPSHNLSLNLGDGEQRQDVTRALAADPGESCHFSTCRFR
jgi:hypothetical protein